MTGCLELDDLDNVPPKPTNDSVIQLFQMVSFTESYDVSHYYSFLTDNRSWLYFVNSVTFSFASILPRS